MKRVLILLCAGLTAMAETSFDDLNKRFENDGSQPTVQAGALSRAALVFGCLAIRSLVQLLGEFPEFSSHQIDP